MVSLLPFLSKAVIRRRRRRRRRWGPSIREGM
jgi:hypothetical protein